MVSCSVAVEGLPGAGKTTLLAWLQPAIEGAEIVPELALSPPAGAELDFFVRNDRRKDVLRRASGRVLMDRFWASTVAYVLADRRCSGREDTVPDLMRELYGHPCPEPPTACVFLDSAGALNVGHARDGRFPEMRFRSFLRQAYFDVFAFCVVPVLVLHQSDGPAALTFVRHALGLSVPAGRGVVTDLEVTCRRRDRTAHMARAALLAVSGVAAARSARTWVSSSWLRRAARRTGRSGTGCGASAKSRRA